MGGNRRDRERTTKTENKGNEVNDGKRVKLMLGGLFVTIWHSVKGANASLVVDEDLIAQSVRGRKMCISEAGNYGLRALRKRDEGNLADDILFVDLPVLVEFALLKTSRLGLLELARVAELALKPQNFS
ncbi:hypothetical protein CIB48_g8167 [Xylaria polymorpha]|nr:hypothetical protein CIB48_g8167 [Xylaria polymorpha]